MDTHSVEVDPSEGQHPWQGGAEVLDAATVDWSEEAGEVLRGANTMDGCVAFNYMLRPSDTHEWYFFSAMTRDEVLLFKAFGSP